VRLMRFNHRKHSGGAARIGEINDRTLDLNRVGPSRSKFLCLGEKDIRYSKADLVSLFRSKTFPRHRNSEVIETMRREQVRGQSRLLSKGTGLLGDEPFR
jgi:hypothetical protein